MVTNALAWVRALQCAFARRVPDCLCVCARIAPGKLGIARHHGSRHTQNMGASQFLVDWARALTGRRRKRAMPRRSAKPAIGARVVLVDAGMRLTVPAGLSDALWLWLLDAGWRVEPYRPDRRHYSEVPRSQVEQLLTHDPELRARLLGKVDRLSGQPTFGFPVSARPLQGAHGPHQASAGVRFLKPTELQADRISADRHPG